MNSPQRARQISPDAFDSPVLRGAPEKIASLDVQASLADAQISRRGWLRRLMVANVLVWTAIVVVVRLYFF